MLEAIGMIELSSVGIGLKVQDAMLKAADVSLVLGRSPYQWQHERVLFGWKKKSKNQWYTGRKESTL